MPAIIDFVNITNGGKSATNSILGHYADCELGSCQVDEYESKSSQLLINIYIYIYTIYIYIYIYIICITAACLYNGLPL